MNQNTTELVASKPVTLAIELAKRGFKVFPLQPGEKTPLKSFKWKKEASADGDVIRKWAGRWPDANYAIATGEDSGLLVVDLDVKKDSDGIQTLRDLEAQFGDGAPRLLNLNAPYTLTVRTPSGGLHLYFQHVGGFTNAVSIVGGVDLRTDGGYVVAPGSVIDGKPYEFVSSPLAAAERMPDWLIEQLRGGGERAGKKPQADTGEIAKGGRNDALTRFAGKLRRLGKSEAEILEALRKRNAERCVPPLDERELRTIARSIGNRPIGDVGYPATELGNAQRIIDDRGHVMRYCFPWRSWVAWDGRRWCRDDDGLAIKGAKAVLQKIRDEWIALIQKSEDDEAKKVGKWVHQSQSRKVIENSLWLARDELAVRPNQLDANDWLLTVENGTIDLKTGRLREHRQADYITKLAPVAYDPSATCPTWECFLREIYEDDELVAFIQRWCGYCLTGSTDEQAFLLLYGTGQNGKSTLLETLLALLGDYAGSTDFKTLLHQDREGVRNDLARLTGLRVVKAVEAEQGSRLSETVIKQLTGGDMITARFLFKEFFEFKPTFKLFLAANHKPDIRGVDKAMWRRVMLVPHDVTIPDDKVDRDLPDKLRAELPGILNWALAGLASYREVGLDPPERVTAATAEYRDEQNILKDFLESECDPNPRASDFETAHDLYLRYTMWCERNAALPIRQKTFGTLLGELGFKKNRRMVGDEKKVIYLGIRLTPREGDGHLPEDQIPF